MNFHEFQEYRASLLNQNPSIVDLGETNLWKSLSHLIPQLPDHAAAKRHRCHLAQAWLDLFSLPQTMAQQALVSSGVRNSLSLLFPIAKAKGIKLQIPLDVYPVYGELARTAGVCVELFPTLPELRLPDTGDWLLIPNPLKPAGRWLTAGEISALQSWLAMSSSRRLLIDAVYTFDRRFHATTHALLQTGQAILLHSLSKGWLHPLVLGIALIPAVDLDSIGPTFRENSPSQENLWKASRLLGSHPDCPQTVAHALTERRGVVSSLLSNLKLNPWHTQESNLAGYMIPLASGADTLLDQHRLLAIPASVFGSTRKDICIVSTLAGKSCDKIQREPFLL